MSATKMKQLTALAEKLTALPCPHPEGAGASDLYTPAHQKAYQRLQIAIGEFGNDPLNLDKSKSILHAIDTYQTANELMMLKARHLVDRVVDSDEDVAYENVFQRYM